MTNKNLKLKDYSICDDFQEQVSNILIRNKSILDILAKLDEYNNRVTRSVVKSVTACGCINIDAKKQDYSEVSFEDMVNSVDSHIVGQLCEDCEDKISEEISSNLFYIAALCDTLDLSLNDILTRETERVKTLGVFTLK